MPCSMANNHLAVSIPGQCSHEKLLDPCVEGTEERADPCAELYSKAWS